MGGVNQIFNDSSLTSNPPLWATFCSLRANNLDAATKTAIEATWGDRGGKLEL